MTHHSHTTSLMCCLNAAGELGKKRRATKDCCSCDHPDMNGGKEMWQELPCDEVSEISSQAQAASNSSGRLSLDLSLTVAESSTSDTSTGDGARVHVQLLPAQVLPLAGAGRAPERARPTATTSTWRPCRCTAWDCAPAASRRTQSSTAGTPPSRGPRAGCSRRCRSSSATRSSASAAGPGASGRPPNRRGALSLPWRSPISRLGSDCPRSLV
jgi:hypothetical protein